MPRHLLLALVIHFMVPALSALGADVASGDAKSAQDERIGKLIVQLGSERFDERTTATRALERIGCPALKALRRAAANDSDAEVRRRAARLVSRIENSLDQLLADYRFFGLPLPPKDAPLVRFVDWPGGTIWFGDNKGNSEKRIVPPTYALGFLVEPAGIDGWAKVLHGTSTQRREENDVIPALDPRRLTVKIIEANLGKSTAALALAVQMHARGVSVAETIFDKGFKRKSEKTPRTALRLLAWEYWDGQLLDPTADHFPAACRHMKALLADERELNTPERRQLLKSLEAALVPHKAKPGSMEALIDDLINVRYRPEFFGMDPEDDRFMRVLDRGFEAVPALLQHLDDDRLTHYRAPQYSWRGHMDPEYHYRVRDLASAILRSLAGRMTSYNWPQDGKDLADLKRRAKAWWDVARKQGEEAYLVAHVLPPERQDRAFWCDCPDTTHVRLLGKKYPHRLPQLYREILERRPNLQSWPLADTLADSALPWKEKVDLLAQAGMNRNLEHRRAAYWRLKDLDHERFVRLLVTTLDHLPRTPPDGIVGCREATFATLSCTTDDPRVWQALERAARRADPGLRMELLAHTDYQRPTPTQHRRRLTFLSAFLDDNTIRDTTVNKELFSGLFAVPGFPRMEIRNFAAMRISQLLGKPAKPKLKWTAADWSKLREQMHAAVKRELAR
jgi:hypothetical protein